MKQLYLILLTALFCASNALSQNTTWQRLSSVPGAAAIKQHNRSLVEPRLYGVDIGDLRSRLKGVPLRSGKTLSSRTVAFPNEDGKLENFSVVESSNMEPALAAKYPEIKSYMGKGIDDPTHNIYFSVSPLGLQSILFRPGKSTLFFEPYTTNRETYILYSSADKSAALTAAECQAIEAGKSSVMLSTLDNSPNADDGILRSYGLALSCTGEYARYFGGTVAGALAGMNATMTRVNAIFETDFGIHMNMVADNDKLIYLNAATDPYTSDVVQGPNYWAQEVMTAAKQVIGVGKFDVAQLLNGIGGGNAAGMGTVCPGSPTDPYNGTTGGYASNPVPEGQQYDNIVAHELGHQFGADHVYSFRADLGTAFTPAQVEPGHGTSIMSYTYEAQVPGQPKNAPYFNAASIAQVMEFVKAASCGVKTPTGNVVPIVDAGPDYTIPKSTPFILQGTAHDPDGDALSYNWEEEDPATVALPLSASASTTGPAFASVGPGPVPYRFFPALSTVLTGATSTAWEVPPPVARSMNFRFTVRDNHRGGPANRGDNMVVNVSSAGPFVITVPNTAVTWEGGSTQTITWNVAGTKAAPVSCANVKISLSVDGGLTFPTVLIASTPNDGSESLTIPNTPSTTARIKVEAVGNIFYDISNTNFYISNTGIFQITSSASPIGYGVVTPSGVTPVIGGSNQVYTISPNETFAVGNVVVDGVSKGAVTTYTFTNVTAPHTIAVTFNYTACKAQGPATITGQTDDLCGVKNVTYTASAVAGASAYEWMVPAGFTLVAGQGTPKVTIKTPASFTTAELKVRATSSCGTSLYTSLTVHGTPGDMSKEITGPSEVVTGSVNVYSLPSSPGFSYTWAADGSTVTDGQNTSSASIKAGSTNGYVTATVMNACGNGPVAKKYFTVKPGTVCTPPTLSAAITNVGCFGAKTGAITLTAVGGSSPYTYQWTGPGGFVSTVKDLSAIGLGSYTVLVTATGGCTATATYSVTQPTSALAITTTPGTIVCTGGTTSVTVAASGGTAPYTGTGAVTEQAAGSHTYTVTDAKGCSISKTIVISPGSAKAPIAPSAITGEIFNLCGVKEVKYTASNVTGASSYTWVIPSGFTVIEGQGTTSVTVSTPSTFTTTTLKVYAVNSCGNSPQTSLTIHGTPGGLSGEITGSSAVVTGSVNVYSLPSTPGFSYAWAADGGSVVDGQNSASASIKAGNSNGYVTATVMNACGAGPVAKKYFTVTPANVCTPPNLSAAITNVGCYGAKTGAINLTAVNGSAPYTYQWTGPGGFISTSKNLISLAPGNYSVLVTATGGCTTSATYSVAQPTSPLAIIVTQGTTGCADETTSVTVAASGGTAPYSGTGVFTERSMGSHTYTVSDANGCSISKSILISASGPDEGHAAPSAITGETFNLCGVKELTYTASAVSGATSYEWILPSGFTLVNGQGTPTVTVKTPTTFTTGELKVRAKSSCGTSPYTRLSLNGIPGGIDEEITGPSEVILGSVNVYSLPSSPGFSYTWAADGSTVVDGQNSASASIRAGNRNGYVTATVTNACGAGPVAKKYFTVVLPSLFKVYPNPARNLATVAFTAAEKDIRYTISVIDSYGQVRLMRTGLTVAGVNTLALNLTRNTAGIYMVTLLMENKIKCMKVFKAN